MATVLKIQGADLQASAQLLDERVPMQHDACAYLHTPFFLSDRCPHTTAMPRIVVSNG